MSRETRQAHSLQLSVRNAARGHDGSVAHSFNHTDGRCPKCGCVQQVMFFCSPNERDGQSCPGCELDGQHIHRACASCRYQWIERPLDQLVFSQERQEVVAESEVAAMLAATVDKVQNIVFQSDFLQAYKGWTLVIERDFELGTSTISVRPPEPQVGKSAKLPQGFVDEAMGK